MSQDVNDGEAAQGGTDEGSSPSETMVPLSALLAERTRGHDRLATKVAELEGKLTAVATKPEREFTRAELQAQVDDGRMTPDESDRIISEQMKRSITQDVTKEIVTANQTTARGERIRAEIKLYTDFKPDILLDGTKDRSLVDKEFQRQKSEFGKPDNVETELDALQAVYGSSARLQVSRARETETFQDTGSDGGGEDSSSDSWPKEMTAGHKNYYQDQINKGRIPDRKTAIEQFNYKPKHGRRTG